MYHLRQERLAAQHIVMQRVVKHQAVTISIRILRFVRADVGILLLTARCSAIFDSYPNTYSPHITDTQASVISTLQREYDVIAVLCDSFTIMKVCLITKGLGSLSKVLSPREKHERLLQLCQRKKWRPPI